MGAQLKNNPKKVKHHEFIYTIEKHNAIGVKLNGKHINRYYKGDDCHSALLYKLEKMIANK